MVDSRGSTVQPLHATAAQVEVRSQGQEEDDAEEGGEAAQGRAPSQMLNILVKHLMLLSDQVVPILMELRRVLEGFCNCGEQDQRWLVPYCKAALKALVKEHRQELLPVVKKQDAMVGLAGHAGWGPAAAAAGVVGQGLG